MFLTLPSTAMRKAVSSSLASKSENLEIVPLECGAD